MKEIGLLNSDIADVISRLGHMDEIIVCDAGFPIPLGVRTVDVALAVNQPTVAEVLAVLLPDFSVERIVLAEETRQHSPSMYARLTALFSAGVAVDTMPHTDFKQHSKTVKAIIRTGDFTAYSNILLVSAGGPRWVVEKP
ncbi:MAG: D-ribose pyranase [Caldilineaceae bacterium]